MTDPETREAVRIALTSRDDDDIRRLTALGHRSVTALHELLTGKLKIDTGLHPIEDIDNMSTVVAAVAAACPTDFHGRVR